MHLNYFAFQSIDYDEWYSRDAELPSSPPVFGGNKPSPFTLTTTVAQKTQHITIYANKQKYREQDMSPPINNWR
jgi:hypothetical protein